MIFIGEAAKRSGASVKAIRHYDKLGLLQTVNRSGSYRIFSERDIKLIKLIKQAQGLGFKLSELHGTISSKECMLSWLQINRMVKLKELQISEKITELQQTQKLLRQYSVEISNCLDTTPDCIDPLK